MKYIIEVEKIKGTNLWKAKEFNTLVFDRNGLDRLLTLEDELGDYYVDLRNEIYELRRKLANSEIEVVEDLKKENKRLWEKVANEKHERILWKHLYKEQEREFNILKKEKEETIKHNSSLEKDFKDFDNICTILKNENSKLKEMYEEKCLEVESLLDTGKLPPNSDFGTMKSHEENVPIEEVVGADLKGMNVVDEETVVRLMTNLFEHSEREWQRLTHTIKSQKGMLKKQGKDISRLQKENEKLKSSMSFWK